MRATESSRAILKGHNGSLWAIYKRRTTASTQILKEKSVKQTDTHLKVFKKFPAELMVKTNGKDDVEDDGSFYVTQLILWYGLHLHIFTPYRYIYKNDLGFFILHTKSNEKRIEQVSYSLSFPLLLFLKLVLLLEVTDDSL